MRARIGLRGHFVQVAVCGLVRHRLDSVVCGRLWSVGSVALWLCGSVGSWLVCGRLGLPMGSGGLAYALGLSGLVWALWAFLVGFGRPDNVSTHFVFTCKKTRE